MESAAADEAAQPRHTPRKLLRKAAPKRKRLVSVQAAPGVLYCLQYIWSVSFCRAGLHQLCCHVSQVTSMDFNVIMLCFVSCMRPVCTVLYCLVRRNHFRTCSFSWWLIGWPFAAGEAATSASLLDQPVNERMLEQLLAGEWQVTGYHLSTSAWHLQATCCSGTRSKGF